MIFNIFSIEIYKNTLTVRKKVILGSSFEQKYTLSP